MDYDSSYNGDCVLAYLDEGFGTTLQDLVERLCLPSRQPAHHRHDCAATSMLINIFINPQSCQLRASW